MSEVIKVPGIGDGEGEVIEILVKAGDKVEAEQSLVVLESDKASMEIPCPKAGTVKSVKVSMGDSLKEGDDLIELEGADGGESEPEKKAESEDSDSKAKQEKQQDKPEEPAASETESESGDAGGSAGGSEVKEVKVPDLGSDSKAEVIEILVAKGDKVEADQSLIVLESDKASMEIPSPFAGTVESVEVKKGDQAGTGDLILHMRTENGAAKSESKPAKSDAQASAPEAEEKKEAKQSDGQKSDDSQQDQPEEKTPPPVGGPSREGAKVHAGPAVRLLAREFGINLAKVKPTGPRDRILKEDVQKYVKGLATQEKQVAAAGGAGIPPVPQIDFSRFGEIETKDMTRLQQAGATNIHRSWLNVPHVTQFDLADISELESFRKAQKAAAEKAGVKLTVLPFLLKACAHLLREMENFNASLAPNGKQLIHKKYVHIGFAVDTPDGLMVPVIRNVDQKSLLELAGEAAELAEKARSKKISADAMQGACFTISSLGHIGGTYFTPIVNAPEVAILGVSKATTQPVWDGEAFQPKLMLPLSLSYDHRAINGAAAAQFTKRLGELLGDIRSMLL